MVTLKNTGCTNIAAVNNLYNCILPGGHHLDTFKRWVQRAPIPLSTISRGLSVCLSKVLTFPKVVQTCLFMSLWMIWFVVLNTGMAQISSAKAINDFFLRQYFCWCEAFKKRCRQILKRPSTYSQTQTCELPLIKLG